MFVTSKKLNGFALVLYPPNKVVSTQVNFIGTLLASSELTSQVARPLTSETKQPRKKPNSCSDSSAKRATPSGGLARLLSVSGTDRFEAPPPGATEIVDSIPAIVPSEKILLADSWQQKLRFSPTGKATEESSERLKLSLPLPAPVAMLNANAFVAENVIAEKRDSRIRLKCFIRIPFKMEGYRHGHEKFTCSLLAEYLARQKS